MTPEERRVFEEWQLGELEQQKKDTSLLGKGLNTLDTLNTLGYAVGGLIESGSTIADNPLDAAKWNFYGAQWKISAAESLGVKQKDTDFWSVRGFAGMGIDILTDPMTYLSLGSGTAVKLTSVGGRAIPLTRVGEKELGKFISKYGEQFGSIEFVHHLEQTPGFAKIMQASEGLSLRGWGPFFRGYEKELVSRSTLDAAVALPGQAWLGWLRTLALSSDTGFELAGKLKGAEEGIAAGIRSLKMGIENRFVAMAAIKRLPRPATLGPREGGFADEFLNYKRSVRYDTGKAIEGATELAKRAKAAFGPDYGARVAELIESPVKRGAAHLSPEQAAIVDVVETHHKAFAVTEKQLGILENEVAGYMRHTLTKKAAAYLQKGGKISSEVYSPFHVRAPFSGERKFQGTVEEINARARASMGFDLFEPNAFAALAVRQTEHIKAVETNRFLDWTTQKYSVPQSVAASNPALYAESRIPQLKGVYLPREIVEFIDKEYRPDDTGVVLKAYDKLTSAWRLSVTAPFPEYHATNVLGAAWNNLLADVNPTSYAKGFKTVWNKGGDAVYTSQLGEKLTAKQLYQEMGEGGVIGQSGYMDVMQEFEFLTLDTARNRALLAWRKFSPTAVVRKEEDVVRATIYIDRRLRGDTKEAARDWAAKTQFDYSKEARTPFETNVMKRTFGFYTYPRSDIPFQVGMMLTQPGKFSAYSKAQNYGLEGEGMPDWMWSYLPLGLNEQGRVRYLTTPLAPLALFGDPEYTYRKYYIGEEQSDASSYTWNAMSPLLKYPYELNTGINSFTGEPYEGAWGPTSGLLYGRAERAHGIATSETKTSEEKTEKLLLGVGTAQTLSGNGEEQFAISAPGYIDLTTKIGIAKGNNWQSAISGNTTGLSIFDVVKVEPGGEQTTIKQVLLTQDELLEQQRALRADLSLHESEYQQNVRWARISEEHFAQKSAIEAAELDRRGRPVNAAQKEQMLYNLRRRTNLRYINVEIKKLQTAINRLEKFVRGEETRGTLQDKRNIAASKIALQSYYDKMQQLKALRDEEAGKTFDLPGQRTDLSQFNPMDIGDYDTLAVRHGIGPKLLHAGGVINQVKLSELAREYQFAVGDIRTRGEMPGSLEDYEELFEEARQMTREMMGEYLSAGMER